MADGIKITTNLPAFKQQLRELGADMERKVIRNAVGAAARVFQKHVLRILARPRKSPIKRGTPPGTLRRAIYIKRARDVTRGREHYFVGVRQGKREQGRKSGSRDAFYWRMVELGHLARRPGGGIRGGKRSAALQRARLNAAGAKRVQAYPFLQPAFQAGQNEALEKFNERVQARIDKENAKR